MTHTSDVHTDAGGKEFEDRVLQCADCREKFVFTAGEQRFFSEQGFKNEPKRCKPCRKQRRGGRS